MGLLSPTSLVPQKQKLTALALVTTISVILLHGFTGWSLLNMPSPLLKPIEKKIQEPIEITILNLEDTVKPQPVPKPEPKTTPPIEPKKQAQRQPKKQPIPIKKVVQPIKKPIVQSKPKQQKPQPIKPKLKPVTQPQNLIATNSAEQQRQKQWEIEQARIQSEADAKRQADLEAKRKANAEAKRQADLEAKRKADAEAKRQADLEAKRKANAEAKRQADLEAKRKADAAANSTNVKLSAVNAKWKAKPQFSVTSNRIKNGKQLIVTFQFNVDKQGNITNVNLVKGSGRRSIDRELTRQAKRGKFYPFKNNSGTTVSGNLTLSIKINAS